MKDSQKEKDEYFIYTQQIATELHEKDDLIYRTPNKFWQKDEAFFHHVCLLLKLRDAKLKIIAEMI